MTESKTYAFCDSEEWSRKFYIWSSENIFIQELNSHKSEVHVFLFQLCDPGKFIYCRGNVVKHLRELLLPLLLLIPNLYNWDDRTFINNGRLIFSLLIYLIKYSSYGFWNFSLRSYTVCYIFKDIQLEYIHQFQLPSRDFN